MLVILNLKKSEITLFDIIFGWIAVVVGFLLFIWILIEDIKKFKSVRRLSYIIPSVFGLLSVVASCIVMIFISLEF